MIFLFLKRDIFYRDKDISIYLKQATIAVEDKDFYHEGAFNVRGLVRAAAHDASGGSTQGGSTISQQLVRLTQSNVGSERTYSRKVKEVILSIELKTLHLDPPLMVKSPHPPAPPQVVPVPIISSATAIA